MDDLLQKLETRLKGLIEKYDQAKYINGGLRQTKMMLAREKEILLSKNKIAISQIESMVARLKSAEKSS